MAVVVQRSTMAFGNIRGTKSSAWKQCGYVAYVIHVQSLYILKVRCSSLGVIKRAESSMTLTTFTYTLSISIQIIVC